MLPLTVDATFAASGGRETAERMLKILCDGASNSAAGTCTVHNLTRNTGTVLLLYCRPWILRKRAASKTYTSEGKCAERTVPL